MRKGTILAISALVGAVTGARIIGKIEGDKRKKAEKLSGKFSALFHMMNQWVKVKQDGKKLSIYFEENKYKRVAIYGMSYVGETLLQELKGTGIEVAYGIDKRAMAIHMDINIVSPDDSLENVDAIVVTVIDFFDEIKEKLSEKLECSIISIEDIVFEV